jgi:hypothetical protein
MGSWCRIGYLLPALATRQDRFTWLGGLAASPASPASLKPLTTQAVLLEFGRKLCKRASYQVSRL